MNRYVSLTCDVLFQWILHDWGDNECIKILKNCKQAIPSRDAGGKVIIIDIVVGSSPSDIKLLETQVLCDLYFMEIGGVERDEEWKKIYISCSWIQGLQYYAAWSPIDYRALSMNDAHCLLDK